VRSSRLDAVCRELRTTRRPIGSIAADCGFANVRSLNNLFKRRYGQTMTDYRHEVSAS